MNHAKHIPGRRSLKAGNPSKLVSARDWASATRWRKSAPLLLGKTTSTVLLAIPDPESNSSSSSSYLSQFEGSAEWWLFFFFSSLTCRFPNGFFFAASLGPTEEEDDDDDAALLGLWLWWEFLLWCCVWLLFDFAKAFTSIGGECCYWWGFQFHIAFWWRMELGRIIGIELNWGD